MMSLVIPGQLSGLPPSGPQKVYDVRQGQRQVTLPHRWGGERTEPQERAQLQGKPITLLLLLPTAQRGCLPVALSLFQIDLNIHLMLFFLSENTGEGGLCPSLLSSPV